MIDDVSIEAIVKVLPTLTYREREILKLRYGLGFGGIHTLVECARIFKITRERVRQIEAKAINKLRHPVRVRKIMDAQAEIDRRKEAETEPV